MRRLLLLFAVVSLVGCAAEGGDDEETGEDAPQALSAGWSSIGNGVAYKRIGDGDGVWIGYGGYSVQLDWSCSWSEELHRAKLKSLGVGHLYAVKGPRDPGYGAREIANTALGAHLLAGPGDDAPFVLVAAHSSGSYVAHELLNQLSNRGASTTELRKKIVYANLDGGGTGFTAGLASSLRATHFVWAEDPGISAGRSANASTMIALGNAYGSPAIRVSAPRSGCNPGAKWCLHDLVITTRPHNPATFDLRRDYSDFAGGRAVQAAWVDALADSLQ